MGLPKVSISLKNGGLGLVAPSDDAVVGLVLNGIGFNNTPFLQPKQIFSLSDFDAWMIASGATGSFVGEAYNQIAEFYRQAGSGSELWVMFVDAVATMEQLFNDGHIETMLLKAEGRIRVLGVSRFQEVEPPVPVLVQGLGADTMNAMDEAHALATAYANRNFPVRFILEAKYFGADAAVLRNLKTYTFNRVAVCLGRTNTATQTTVMGMLLGRIAAIPVNRSIGRVKDGPATVNEAYLGTRQAKAVGDGFQGAVHDKGYIFLRKHNGKGGFYFNADPMATSDTDDYNRLNRGRVIDKAHRIAYQTFLEELLDEVLVDENTGRILATTIKQYQARIERAIDKSMTTQGEISGVQAFIDPAQDILGTNTLNVDLRIAPTGTNEVIKVSLGLYNPQAAI